jgi:mevalonate pyrophosphate decarboxylase
LRKQDVYLTFWAIALEWNIHPYTIDAGPNVHVICLQENVEKITEYLKSVPGVTNVLVAKVGGAARLVA